MLMATTDRIENTRTVKHGGLVSGSATYALGSSIFGWFRALRAAWCDWFGGNTLVVSESLNKAKETALEAIIKEAEKRGANAIVGVRTSMMPYIPKGRQSELVYHIYGTAVTVQPCDTEAATVEAFREMLTPLITQAGGELRSMIGREIRAAAGRGNE